MNAAAIKAATDIPDFIDGRDENDLWDKDDETMLEELLETLTIRRQRREYTWEQMLKTRPEGCSVYEFREAIRDMDQYKGHVCQFSQSHAMVTKNIFFIHKHPNYLEGNAQPDRKKIRKTFRNFFQRVKKVNKIDLKEEKLYQLEIQYYYLSV